MAAPELSSDLIESATSIAEYLGMPTRRVFYLAERGKLPIFKIGMRWCARKSTLLAHIKRLEAAGVPADERTA